MGTSREGRTELLTHGGEGKLDGKSPQPAKSGLSVRGSSFTTENIRHEGRPTPRQTTKRRRLPIRMVSLGYQDDRGEVEQFSRQWTKRIARLNSQFDKIHYVGNLNGNPGLRLMSQYPEWRQVLESKQTNIQHILRLWSKLEPSQQSQDWPQFMIWIMYHRLGDTLDALEATLDSAPYPAKVADCLDIVVGHHLGNVHQLDVNTMPRILSLVHRILQERRTRAPIHQRALRLLFQHADAFEAKRLFDALVEASVMSHSNTLLHIAKALASHGLANVAMDTLKKILRQGTDVTSENVMKLCTTTLIQTGSQPGGHRKATVLLGQLLEYGVQPNVITFNAVIRNAVRVGQLPAGKQIYEAMKADGIQPDVYTFSILISGAKRQSDWQLIDYLIYEMREMNIQPDAYLITDLLHTTYLFIHTQHHKSPFQEMLARYEDWYSTATLRRLGFLLPGAESLSVTRPDAPPVLVSLMLSAYLKHCHDWKVLSMMYTRYRTEVAARNSSMSDVTTSAYMLNSFLHAFVLSSDTLPYATAIIEDMLNPSSGLSPPTVHSWTILLNGYMRHDQPQAAEKVVDLMYEHGQPPNTHTWNLLIRGYARRQDIEGVASAVKRMKHEGWQHDEYTLGHLTRIWDREGLQNALAEIEEEEDEQDDDKIQSGRAEEEEEEEDEQGQAKENEPQESAQGGGLRIGDSR